MSTFRICARDLESALAADGVGELPTVTAPWRPPGGDGDA